MLDEYPDVLTVSDIKKILKIGHCKAYELTHDPDFPTIKIGRAIRIPKKKFIEWLEKERRDKDEPGLFKSTQAYILNTGNIRSRY